MTKRQMVRTFLVLASIVAATVSIQSLRTEAAAKRCPRGVRACSAAQVGQPCTPDNLNIICSAQSGNRYCCLAYAP